jgi:RecB family endonuclease NucS
MDIKELRLLIKDLPDNMPVAVMFAQCKTFDLVSRASISLGSTNVFVLTVDE